MTTDSSPNKFGWLGAILLVFLFQGFSYYSWARQDTRPLAWDQAIHTNDAFDYQARFSSHRLSEIMKPTGFNYPPLYHFSLIPALHWVSSVEDAGAAVNYFYLCFLMLAVFLIGDRLLGRWPAFTAMVLIGCYPVVTQYARQTLIDVSLATWVSWSVLCLLRSENFSKPSGSIAFGIFLGLGMMAKWTALAYVLGPLLWASVQSIREKRIKWLVLSILVAGLVMAPWYLFNIFPMLSRIPNLVNHPPAGQEHLTGLANKLWYPITLLDQLDIFFLLLLIPGFIFSFWHRKMAPILLWFALSLFLFSLIRNKNVRYDIPALPAAALLSVAWLPSSRRWPYLLILVFTTVFSVVQFFTGHDLNVRAGSWSVPVMKADPPLEQNWQHDAIIDRIVELKPKDRRFTRVVTVSNAAFLHSQTLNVSLRKRGVSDVGFRGTPRNRYFEFADFVLIKTGDVGPDFTTGNERECLAYVAKSKWFSKAFKEVGRWPLPDGSQAMLYQWNPDPVKIPEIGLFNLSLDELVIPNVVAHGVTVRAVPLSNRDTSVGRYKELAIHCDHIVYKDIEFSGVTVRLLKPQINLPLFFETQEIQLANVQAIEPHATASADVLLKYASKKAKWLKNLSLSFNGSTIFVAGQTSGIPIKLRADVKIDHDFLKTKMEKIQIGGLPFPLILIKAVTDIVFSLKSNDSMAYDLNIDQIYGDGPTLRIGT